MLFALYLNEKKFSLYNKSQRRFEELMILKRLRDLREDNDMTQKEMADILGISQRYYSN